MRRSRSFSNIPLPTSRRISSNENVGNSQQGLKTSQNWRRSNSSSNLLSAQKFGQSKNESSANNDIQSSVSKSCNRRITATPLRSVQDTRKTNTTPFSVSKFAPSPCVMLKTSQINDKKFSSDQYRKICEFMHDRVEDFDPKCLKPLSLGSFVQTVSQLFREIDPRINITMANYKEVVYKYLKLYKYPGPVSMSLLKSVNTNISWTQVMSIFGWMVDLVNQLKPTNTEDPLEQYIMGRSKIAIHSGIETKGLCIEFIEQLLKFDKTESETLEDECNYLRKEADNKRLSINEQKNEETALAEQLEQMKVDIRDFKEDNLEEKIRNEIGDLQAQLQSRATKILEVKASNNDTRKTISNQKYSLEDKKKLLHKLENKKYSLSLKKEELENIIKLKDDNDHQLTNSRRLIENEIHEINGRLVQCKLGNYIDTKQIRLPDRGIHKSNFTDEIEEKKNVLEKFHDKINCDIQTLENNLFIGQNRVKELCNIIGKLNDKINIVKKENEGTTTEISRILLEFDFTKKQHDGRMSKLEQEAKDFEFIKERKSSLQKELLGLRENFHKIKNEFFEIKQNLTEETNKEAAEMRGVMAALAEQKLAGCILKVERETEMDKFTENI